MKVTVGVGPSNAAVEVKQEPESGDEYGKYGLGYYKQLIQKNIMCISLTWFDRLERK